MEKVGKTITSFLLGATVGVVVGYVLATDKETRKEDLEKVRSAIKNVKGKFAKKATDLDEEIYHS